MSKEVELKPCPCCGGEARKGIGMIHCVYCPKCGLHAFDKERWNTRPTDGLITVREEDLSEKNLLTKVLMLSETEDLEPPYRCLPCSDPQWMNKKAKRLSDYIKQKKVM